MKIWMRINNVTQGNPVTQMHEKYPKSTQQILKLIVIYNLYSVSSHAGKLPLKLK